MNKATLRALYRTSPPPTAEEAEAILKLLTTHPFFREARRVCAYVALPDEVSTAQWLPVLAREKELYLPAVVDDAIEVRRFHPDAPMRQGRFAIWESQSDEIVPPDAIDLFLIPAIAYDRRGYRLGRGKGYYDRLLAHTSAHTMGIVPSSRLLDGLPNDPWDIPVEAIVTETTLFTTPKL